MLPLLILVIVAPVMFVFGYFLQVTLIHPVLNRGLEAGLVTTHSGLPYSVTSSFICKSFITDLAHPINFMVDVQEKTPVRISMEKVPQPTRICRKSGQVRHQHFEIIYSRRSPAERTANRRFDG